MNKSSQTHVKKRNTNTVTHSGLIQRRATCYDSSAGEQCDECREKESTLDQRSGLTKNNSILPRLRAGTLDRTRIDPFADALLRGRFGHSFGRVSVLTREDGVDSMQTVQLSDGQSKRGTPVPGGKSDKSRADDMELSARIEVVHPTSMHRASFLSDTGDAEAVASEDSEGIIKLAQTPGGPIAPPVGPVAPPSCSFAISYANIRNTGCGAGQCGAQIIYDVVGVTATGSGCPSLNGLRVTESVTTNNGCGPGSVTTGAGCPIEEHPPMMPGHGQVKNCTDTYALCGPAGAFPAAGCTEVYTQQLSVGGQLAETRTITFTITKSGGSCSGAVTRT